MISKRRRRGSSSTLRRQGALEYAAVVSTTFQGGETRLDPDCADRGGRAGRKVSLGRWGRKV